MPSMRNGHSMANSNALACHFVQSCSKRVWISLRKLCSSCKFLRLTCVSDASSICYWVLSFNESGSAAILNKLTSLPSLAIDGDVRRLQLKEHISIKLFWARRRV
ncbi:hypothetical protein CHOCRA_000161 [Candidatus Hodgkinia cicadicola]|nr:hypothetical protein CHOCRA_000161 [Candidatus Hodgkinia cicadicola]